MKTCLVLITFAFLCFKAEAKILLFSQELIIKKDDALIEEFIKQSFSITDDETKKVLSEVMHIKDRGGYELLFWKDLGEKLDQNLPEDWMKMFVQKECDSIRIDQDFAEMRKDLEARGFSIGIVVEKQSPFGRKLRKTPGEFPKEWVLFLDRTESGEIFFEKIADFLDVSLDSLLFITNKSHINEAKSAGLETVLIENCARLDLGHLLNLGKCVSEPY